MSGPPAGVVTLAPGTWTQMLGVPLPPGPGGTLAPDGVALTSVRAPAATRPASAPRSVIDMYAPLLVVVQANPCRSHPTSQAMRSARDADADQITRTIRT